MSDELPREDVVAVVDSLVEELLTAAVQSGCVGVSTNTQRWNPFVRRVIPNGVDLTIFYPEAETKTDQPSVLFVGALTGRKRGKLMLDWFTKRIRVAVPAAMLDFVGAWPDRQLCTRESP